MKKILFLLIAILSMSLSFQPIYTQETSQPTVTITMDPRVELMSLIFRIAGNPEYSNGKSKQYNEYIAKHFGDVDPKNFEAIQAARKLYKNYGVSFDAVMSMAVHITDAAELKEKVPFDPRPTYLDTRWEIPEARLFLAAARRFAQDVRFDVFIEKAKELYDTTVQRMKKIVEGQGHMEWFDVFFGPRKGLNFFIVPGLLNDGHSYGVRIKLAGDIEELYCVLGASAVDNDGFPVYDNTFIPTIIHEFCHSYVNSLVDKYENYLKKSGEKLFTQVSEAMNRQHYGNWKIMIYESIVRASVIRYVTRFDSEDAAKKLVAEEVNNKFLWMDGLSNLLGEYEKNRKDFPTLESFFPKITEFFDKIASGNDKAPKIITMIPENGAKDVDPELQFITIRFDRPMKNRSWSILGEGLKVPEMPREPYYQGGNMILTIPVKLNPGWTYDFWLNSEKKKGFMSELGEPLEPVHIQFGTR
jgi:hypothetical protein